MTLESSLPIATYIAILAFVGWICVKRLGYRNPISLWVLYWGALGLAHAFLPLGIYPASASVLAIILVGVVAFAGGGLLVPLVRPSQRSEAVPMAGSTAVSAAITVLLIAVVVGYFSFRSGIESRYGLSFAEMTTAQVRYAQVYMEGDAGIGGLMFILAPVASCLVVLGAMYYGRWWLGLLPLIIFMVAQSPSRTGTLGLVTTTLVFYLYARSGSGVPRRGDNRRILVVAALLIVAGIAYFIGTGLERGQGAVLEAQTPGSWLPKVFLSPLMYLLGGISAFSVALETNVDPTHGGEGKSVYVFLRVLSEFDSRISVPDTVDDYVYMPNPFNVYTGFADAWFDWKIWGVLFIFGGFGFLVACAHRAAQLGHLGGVFAASVLISVAVSSPVTLRLLSLETVIVVSVGYLVFSRLQHSPDGCPRRRQPATYRPFDWRPGRQL